MKINEKNAKKIFLENFPNGIGYDIADRKMILDHYGRSDLETGWNIDHILAVSRGGTNAKTNLQCTNIKTNLIKTCKTTWQDNDLKFQVRRTKFFKKVYEIVKVNECNDKKEYNLDDREYAIKLFKQQYPLGVGYDPIGRKIVLDDYLKKDVYSGWAVIKLNPKNTKLTNDKNYAIFNIVSINEKQDKIAWIDNDRYFQVEKKDGKFIVVEVIHKNGYTSKKGAFSYGISA